jgi:hypothetical protein
MEQIYTIPVNEAFDASKEKPECGCPFCSIYRKLEDNELEIILGASMMEPDIRIMTNQMGFCHTHYDMMLKRSNRLGMALTLESHLDLLRKEIDGSFMSKLKGDNPAVARIDKLEKSCYVCARAENNFSHMIETAVLLWDSDPDFRAKFDKQPYFCLPHYKRMVDYASRKLAKRRAAEFLDTARTLEMKYFDKLREDVSWFCKKFDYRYESEPWYDSKDAIERAIAFLRSDLHRDTAKEKKP